MSWEAVLSALVTVGVAAQVGNWAMIRRLEQGLKAKVDKLEQGLSARAEKEEVKKLEEKFCEHSHEGLAKDSGLIFRKG